MGKSGDFTYASAAFEAAQEYNQDERTATQRAADKAKRAPVTTDYQRWKSDPSGLDFPGVDTPSASPEVLPKDLKQSQKPELSARAQNEAPGQTLQTTTEDLERQQLSQMGVSPGEGRDSMVADGMGGVQYNRNVGGYVETDRPDEEQKPPDIERGEDPFDMSNGGGALDDSGSGFEPGRDEREAIRQLERNSPGREAEQIEKVRLFDDPPEDALETFGDAADRVVNNRDEITDTDRTDTSFLESDTIDTIDRLRSEVR